MNTKTLRRVNDDDAVYTASRADSVFRGTGAFSAAQCGRLVVWTHSCFDVLGWAPPLSQQDDGAALAHHFDGCLILALGTGWSSTFQNHVPTEAVL